MNGDSPMPFGKHKGKPLRKVPRCYWLWLIDQYWLDAWGELLIYCEERAGRKFTATKPVREPKTTRMGVVTGVDFDPSLVGTDCPF